jgi:hypothetical protein
MCGFFSWSSYDTVCICHSISPLFASCKSTRPRPEHSIPGIANIERDLLLLSWNCIDTQLLWHSMFLDIMWSINRKAGRKKILVLQSRPHIGCIFPLEPEGCSAYYLPLYVSPLLLSHPPPPASLTCCPLLTSHSHQASWVGSVQVYINVEFHWAVYFMCVFIHSPLKRKEKGWRKKTKIISDFKYGW